MCQEKLYCDTILHCGPRAIQVETNSIILGSVSRILSQVLKDVHNLGQLEPLNIVLPDFDASEVEQFLSNLYIKILTNDPTCDGRDELSSLLGVFDFPDVPLSQLPLYVIKAEAGDGLSKDLSMCYDEVFLSNPFTGVDDCDKCDYDGIEKSKKEVSFDGVRLKDPEAVNDDYLICDNCNELFSSKASLIKHMKEAHLVKEQIAKPVHSEPPKEACPYCNKSFANLSQHLKSKHQEDKKPYSGECELCAQKFSNKSNLSIHVRTIHEGELKFSCKFCERSFSRNYALKRHVLMIHKGMRLEDNAMCTDCGKRFTQKSSLFKHQREVHMGRKRKEDAFCEDCGRSFAQRGTLYLHMRKVHGKEPTVKKNMMKNAPRRLIDPAVLAQEMPGHFMVPDLVFSTQPTSVSQEVPHGIG